MQRKIYQKPCTGKITFDYKVIASASDDKPLPFVPIEEDEWDEDVPIDDNVIFNDLENW